MDQGWASIHRKKNLFPVKLPLIIRTKINIEYNQSYTRILFIHQTNVLCISFALFLSIDVFFIKIAILGNMYEYILFSLLIDHFSHYISTIYLFCVLS